MRRRIWALPAMALALGLLGTPATAAPTHTPAKAPGAVAGQASTGQLAAHPGHQRGKGKSLAFAAVLTGDQEISDKGRRGAGDRDGEAVIVMKVKGNKLVFALKWRGIKAPSAGHIHIGGAGRNGDVKVPLFGTAMPRTARAAAGHVKLDNAAIAQAIGKNPGGFYVNIHNKEFPGGAVRGQLRHLGKAVNPLDIIKAGKLRAFASGFQEVSDNGLPLAGDLDGFGVAFVDPRHDRAHYSVAWLNIGTPQAAHIHEGGAGRNGKVRFPLFTEPVPSNVFALSGVVHKLNPAGLKHIAGNSRNFYFNLHNKEFPGGAIRGQLHH
ncbi:CHRD domain-containing protein [Streptomyces durbertensis]|uniref:CHRD domain-containing protein n=1 Tax=Streptomyces durbertensis TaxID=2448886 RepID=A0ABR6EG37_9ACTN|nr:CHRD domain-containing protein [Streptomyces durbertensis]MBB1244294.1 CHRD domain-containing protein [Streptomyces durbertensis]